MATAADLTTACVRAWDDERLADVAPRLTKVGGHHCAVFERVGEKFLGLVRMVDVAAYANPGNRLLADLIASVEPLRVRSDESAESTAEIFEQYGLAEVVVVDPFGAFVGVATAQSALAWTVRELRRKNAELALRAVSQESLESLTETATPDGLPVLVVEDHESSRWALVRILGSRGIRAISVGSVADALKLTRYQRFAAVLSDIGLPDGNGYELMAILQAQYNVPCISMTAFDELAEPPGQKNVQLTAHLTKPLHIQDIDTVVEVLKSVIARSFPVKVGNEVGIQAQGSKARTRPNRDWEGS